MTCCQLLRKAVKKKQKRRHLPIRSSSCYGTNKSNPLDLGGAYDNLCRNRCHEGFFPEAEVNKVLAKMGLK